MTTTTKRCNLDITRIYKINFILVLLSLVFFLSIINCEIHRRKLFIKMTIIISAITRLFQYWFIIAIIKAGRCNINFFTLLSCYVTHYILFTSMYYLNYDIHGIHGFNFLGGPPPGNDIDTIVHIKSASEFENNIHINLSYYTVVTSFMVGYNDVTARTKLAKLTNMIHMADAAFLLLFLFGKLFDTQ